MAVGCISAVTERGSRVPEQISVVGFDDVRLASFSNPPLTTIAQPKREIGELATEILFARIHDLDAPPRFERLETTLIIRRSTTERRKSDWRRADDDKSYRCGW